VYTDADQSLAAVLLGELQSTGQTLGVAEVGTGGRFGSLLFTEPEANQVVRGLTVTAAGDPPPNAEAVAEDARHQLAASLGLGIVADVARNESGQYEGTITVALAGAITACETFSLRAMFPEIQRRSALNAADVLHRALIALPDAPSA
jgi:nicotinamide mononucleotide (NMN) deamidase PncC